MSKSKYETNVKPHLEKIAVWVTAGASQAEVAKKLHITKSTLALYLKKGRDGEEPYSGLSDCFACASVEPDDNVEAALYKSALGYTVDLQKTFKLKISEFDPVTGKKTAEYEKLVTGIDQVHVPANVEAQKFWLANRRRANWQYRPVETTDLTAADDERGVIMIPAVSDPSPAPLPTPKKEGD